MDEFRPVAERMSGQLWITLAKVRVGHKKFIARTDENLSRFNQPNDRIQGGQQHAILVEKYSNAASNPAEHVVQQPCVPVFAGQRVQLRPVSRAHFFCREELAPNRTRVRHHHPRFGMKTADRMQAGVEKFRRIKMGDAKGDGSLRRRAQELLAAGQHGRTQPPAENKASNVWM